MNDPRLPAGAEQDPRAPWNQPDEYCSCCQREEIFSLYRQEYPLAEELDDDGNLIDPQAPDEEDYVDAFGLCDPCERDFINDN
jgi:hypothetical protein